MAIAFGTQHHLMATASSLMVERPAFYLRGLGRWMRGPDAGSKPQGLRVSQRAWKRNSALLTVMYEQDKASS